MTAEMTVACREHRACCGVEHDPANGKLHGCCVICGVPWPCDVAKVFMDAALGPNPMNNPPPTPGLSFAEKLDELIRHAHSVGRRTMLDKPWPLSADEMSPAQLQDEARAAVVAEYLRVVAENDRLKLEIDEWIRNHGDGKP